MNLGHFSLSEERGHIFIFLDPKGACPFLLDPGGNSWPNFLFFPLQLLMSASEAIVAVDAFSKRSTSAGSLQLVHPPDFYAMFNSGGPICVLSRRCVEKSDAQLLLDDERRL